MELGAFKTRDGFALTFTFDTNAAGQVRCEDLVEQGLAEDTSEAAEMLDAAPSDVRYGYVHPGPNVETVFDAAIRKQHAAVKARREGNS